MLIKVLPGQISQTTLLWEEKVNSKHYWAITAPTDYDGDIVVSITCLETGSDVPLPSNYLPVENLVGFFQSALGVEARVVEKEPTKLN